jgi:predicted Zn-dependent protease
VMRFSNSPTDTDIKSRAFCVKHQAKLRARRGQVPLKSSSVIGTTRHAS